jgi:hypothetical protein
LEHDVVNLALEQVPLGRFRGECGECEAIAEYLLNVEAQFGIKITTIQEALPYTRGTKIQTRIIETSQPHPPCESCSPLLEIFQINYTP